MTRWKAILEMNSLTKTSVLIILFIIVCVAFYHFTDKSPLPLSANYALSVTYVQPVQKTILETLNVTGATMARDEIMVSTELSGMRVREVLADVGDSVEKGQVLAVLDGESLNNQLAQLDSEYERSRDEFNRMNAIKNSGAVSKENLLQRQSAMKVAKARLDDARLNVKRSTIVAPESGLIFERKATIGALINTSEPLYRIARGHEIEIEASIPEAELSKLIKDQKTEIVLNGAAHPIEGKIRLITPYIDPSSRSAKIRITGDKLPVTAVGLFATVRLVLGEKQGTVLPATALQRDEQGLFVWSLDTTNKAVRLPITLLTRTTDEIMVEGVSADSRIIARAGAFVKEGEEVNVVEKAP
jgi:RND family efflux transporter MFP subunit